VVLGPSPSKGYVQATSVVQGAPAEAFGLKENDVIYTIDGQSAKKIGLIRASEKIRGPNGSVVRLGVLREVGKAPVWDTIRQCFLPRAQKLAQVPEVTKPGSRLIELVIRRGYFDAPVVYHDLIEVRSRSGAPQDVAYIALTDFTDSAARQMGDALNHLALEARRKSIPIIVDLRGNGGGVFDEAIDLTRMFFRRPGTSLVKVVDREQTLISRTSFFGSSRFGSSAPFIVVLVDRFSASASEIFAAAIQDNCRGILVGSRTFGKGSVQAVLELEDGAGIIVTIARYETPRGSSIAYGKGLKPDITMNIPYGPTPYAIVTSIWRRIEDRVDVCLKACRTYEVRKLTPPIKLSFPSTLIGNSM